MAKEQTINISMLEPKGIDELVALATELGLDNGTGLQGLRRDELINLILHNYSDNQDLIGQGQILLFYLKSIFLFYHHSQKYFFLFFAI